jgi:hypothetical protein
MGGFGSGRSGWHSTVEDCLIICASRWTREGILREGIFRSGWWQWTSAISGETLSSLRYAVDTRELTYPVARLMYTFTKSGERLDYPVVLQTTRPQFGGLRWWFKCPLSVGGRSCGRRVQKLFLPPGGRYYGCRHCYNLTYQSRREDAKNRALTKTQRIRVRLGGDASLGTVFPSKPKGMWERTYRRLEEQALEAEARSWILLGDWIARVDSRQRVKPRER